MPQYSEPEQLTPFAQVLTDYMWNRRNPRRAPMAVPQLAAKLGLPRQNVHNWIYRSTVPTFDVILAVLARLDIPLRTLYDIYVQAGLTVPRWDDSTPASRAGDLPTISRSRKHIITVPNDDDEDDGVGTPKDTYAHDTSATSDALTPRPYIPPTPRTPEEIAAADYDRMIAQTTATMRDEGFPPSVIAAAIASIRAQQHSQQTGAPTRMEQHILAEHSEPSPEPAAELPEQQSGQKSKR